MWLFKKERADYKFKVISPSDYALVFKFEASNKLFSKLYSAADKKVKDNPDKLGITVISKEKVNLDYVDEFEITSQYYNYIHTVIKSLIKKVNEQTSPKGIVLTSSKVVYAKFKRQSGSEDWNIFIKVEGVYDDRRHMGKN